jgi:hypothetical protein
MFKNKKEVLPVDLNVAPAASISSKGGVGGSSRFLPQVQGGEGGGGSPARSSAAALLSSVT